MEDITFEDKIVRKINEAREFLGMNREDFGQLFGMVKSSVSKLENGKHKMFVHKLIDIANAIKVDLSYFFNNQPYPEAVSLYIDTLFHEDVEKQGLEYEEIIIEAFFIKQLGNLSENENLLTYLKENHITNLRTQSTEFPIYTKRKINAMLNSLSVKELNDFYSYTLWFMRQNGYLASHFVKEGVYREG